MNFDDWTFHRERNLDRELRLVATNKTTGAVVRGTWIADGENESPYINADRLVPGAQGYVEAHLGDARLVVHDPLSPLGPTVVVSE
jgi:hypothetical protein